MHLDSKLLSLVLCPHAQETLGGFMAYHSTPNPMCPNTVEMEAWKFLEVYLQGGSTKNGIFSVVIELLHLFYAPRCVSTLFHIISIFSSLLKI
jgi:hypothetical protein